MVKAKIGSERKKEIIKKYFLCKKCKSKHKFRNCPAYGKKCLRCNKFNHFAVVCKNKRINNVDVDNDSTEKSALVGSIEVGTVDKTDAKEKSNTKIFENIRLENSIVKFKLDTGAEVNLICINDITNVKNL